MDPISIQAFIDPTEDDGSVLSPQSSWALSDFKS